MKFGNRYLPYPTFNEHGELNCYLRGHFRFKAMPAEDPSGEHFVLKDVHYETNSPLLRRLVAEGKAGVLMVVECQDTVRRMSRPISETPENLSFSISDLSGKIEVSAFAYATCDLTLSSDNDFSPEFQGQDFFIEKNSFLAIADGFSTSCIRQASRDDHVDSIFTVSKTGDETGPFNVELREGKIDIQVPKDMFAYYSRMRRGNTKNFFFSSLLVPALAEALWMLKSECQQDETIEIYELFSKYRWLPALAKGYKKAFGKELSAEALREQEHFASIAQGLLGLPVMQGIKDYNAALIGANAREE